MEKNPRLINLHGDDILFPRMFSEHDWKLYLHCWSRPGKLGWAKLGQQRSAGTDSTALGSARLAWFNWARVELYLVCWVWHEQTFLGKPRVAYAGKI